MCLVSLVELFGQCRSPAGPTAIRPTPAKFCCNHRYVSASLRTGYRAYDIVESSRGPPYLRVSRSRKIPGSPLAREDTSPLMRRPRGHYFPRKGPAHAQGAGSMISPLALMASLLGLRNWMVKVMASTFYTHDSGFTIPRSCFWLHDCRGHVSGLTIHAVTVLAS